MSLIVRLKILLIIIILTLGNNVYTAENIKTITINGKEYKFTVKIIDGKEFIEWYKFNSIAQKIKVIEESNPEIILPVITIIRDKQDRVYTKIKPDTVVVKLGYIKKVYKLRPNDIKFEYTYSSDKGHNTIEITPGLYAGYTNAEERKFFDVFGRLDIDWFINKNFTLGIYSKISTNGNFGIYGGIKYKIGF